MSNPLVNSKHFPIQLLTWIDKVCLECTELFSNILCFLRVLLYHQFYLGEESCCHRFHLEHLFFEVVNEFVSSFLQCCSKCIIIQLQLLRLVIQITSDELKLRFDDVCQFELKSFKVLVHGEEAVVCLLLQDQMLVKKLLAFFR